ncbi:MAG: metallophosphoesterase [Chitinophagia bacterium]|nr:metallophosphoesterase [Chitinophagia bacterium]
MARIGLISDTHGFLDDGILGHLASCDEIWHAGDIGDTSVSDRLSAFRLLRAVHGNIDGQVLRVRFPEKLHWTCEGMPVLMMHIGGHPGRYTPDALAELRNTRPRLFITGHSHILKVARDAALGCLHINPGAAGLQGWHRVRTLMRFTIEAGELRDMEVVELMPRRPGKTISK